MKLDNFILYMLYTGVWVERAGSGFFYVQIAREDCGLFRFLLEAYANLAIATTLDRRAALLKIVFAPGSAAIVETALQGMRRTIKFEIIYPPGEICPENSSK